MSVGGPPLQSIAVPTPVRAQLPSLSPPAPTVCNARAHVRRVLKDARAESVRARPRGRGAPRSSVPAGARTHAPLFVEKSGRRPAAGDARTHPPRIFKHELPAFPPAVPCSLSARCLSSRAAQCTRKPLRQDCVRRVPLFLHRASLFFSLSASAAACGSRGLPAMTADLLAEAPKPYLPVASSRPPVGMASEVRP